MDETNRHQQRQMLHFEQTPGNIHPIMTNNSCLTCQELDHVLELNKVAIANLIDGAFGDASDNFNSALASLQGLARSLHVRNTDVQASTAVDELPHELAVVAINQGNECGDEDSSNVLPMFNRAITVAPSIQPGNRWSQYKLLIALIYNLGLCYHLLGTRLDCAKSLRMALELYEKAVTLLVEATAEADGPTDSSDDFVLLFLALFYNMANIYAATCDIAGIDRCVLCMRSITCSKSYQRLVSKEEDHFFFFLNLFVTAPKKLFALAPAA